MTETKDETPSPAPRNTNGADREDNAGVDNTGVHNDNFGAQDRVDDQDDNTTGINNEDDSPVETMSYSPVDSPVETIFTGPCTRVFWDVVDFPFPDGLDPDLIYQNMKSILEKMGFLGEVSIMAYVDKENFAEESLDAYQRAGITIIPHPQQGGKYDRCRVMFLDIAWWSNENFENPFSPLNLMVISKLIGEQSGFLKYLKNLAYANYTVLLAMPQLPQDLSSELHTVSFNCLSTSLLDGGKPIDQSGTVQGLNHKRKSRDDSEETVRSRR